VAFWVAQPGCGARREHTGEHLRCIGGQGKRHGRGVLLEAADVARAGNWYDKRLLRQPPPPIRRKLAARVSDRAIAAGMIICLTVRK
jgi:hypothetical protein